jgi:CBS domain-containing protein
MGRTQPFFRGGKIMKIRTILATKGSHVVTISPSQTIRQVLQVLVKYNFGALVIVDESSRPIGIISERDIVRLAASDEQCFSKLVQDVMTTELILGLQNDDIRAVANTMTEKRIRHLPVVDNDGLLIGMISIGDIVKAERNHFEGEAEVLLTQIMANSE